MARDQLIQHPRISRLILAIGAIIYFIICLPLYGRRGFPEVDPFWLAMIWLWIPPVIISAIYDKWRKRRLFDLIIYALVAGFVVSWGTLGAVPSNKSPFQAIIELIIVGPILFVFIILLEALSRLVLARIRHFPQQKQCENCDYCLFGLTEPRCPECGKPFPAELLSPDYHPIITPFFRRWSTLLIALISIITLAFPFIDRAYIFHSCAISGERQAERDWKHGIATWHVTRDEYQAMTPSQQENFEAMRFQKDSSTGLWIELMWKDWRTRTWSYGYRNVIERKLYEAGLKPPNFEQGASMLPAATTTATNPSIMVE